MLASVYIFAVVWPAFVSISRKQTVTGPYSSFFMTQLKVTRHRKLTKKNLFKHADKSLLRLSSTVISVRLEQTLLTQCKS